MSLPTALSTLCETLRTGLGVPVALGLPETAEPALHVWPWRLEELADAAHPPVHTLPHRPGTRLATPAQAVHLLLMVQPANTAEGLRWLAEARMVLLAHPVLQVEGATAQVLLSPLPVEQLTSLFLAARLPLRLCLSAVLRGG